MPLGGPGSPRPYSWFAKKRTGVGFRPGLEKSRLTKICPGLETHVGQVRFVRGWRNPIYKNKRPQDACLSMMSTEARSEGSIELKLVRKPPKVSRGYGGVAPAALCSGLRVGEELSARIPLFEGHPLSQWHSLFGSVWGSHSGIILDLIRSSFRTSFWTENGVNGNLNLKFLG